MSTVAPHIPVMLAEVMTALAVQSGETFVDGTYGAGGYSNAILGAGAQVIAFDRDPQAIAAAHAHIGLKLIEAKFSQLGEMLEAPVDGVVLDIGVSSMQLDQPERGFSFQQDGALDMRMGTDGDTAADFLNTADEAAIADILYQYGEEPKSRRIARAILANRPITRTAQLASLVRRAVGYKPHDKKDPATRTFQALRIHVNQELDELALGLAAAEVVLKPGGRLVVVTFHSLEDRIVKRFFRERSGGTPSGSRHVPYAANQNDATFELLSKAVRPAAEEIARNARARSATLRAATRTAQPLRRKIV